MRQQDMVSHLNHTTSFPSQGRIGKVDAEFKVLPHFETYQAKGYYPFDRESFGQCKERLMDAVNKVLEVDYPALEDVSQETMPWLH